MPETHTPASFGRFDVVRELGRGAFGRVFLARDPTLDRLVAVKVLDGLDGLADAERREAVERFRREARAAAALTHPNIVTIYDVGEQDGTPFIAMEYIEGTTLDRFTRKGHLLPAAKVLDVGIQAATALDAAHRAGIVHRDIKPANLVLLADGTVKVTDFGLAKDTTTTLTASDSLLGTPNYMSPEQIAGRTLDGRSDLFSLAVSLYELLAGQRPFPGDTVSSVLYRIVNEPPVPLARHRPDLPQELHRFFSRALAKSPSQRPADAATFANELRRILVKMGGVPKDLQLPEPTGPVRQERPAPPRGRARPAPAGRSRRRRPPVRNAIVLLLLIGLLGAVAAWTAPLWADVDPLGDLRAPIEARLADWLGAAAGWITIGPVERRVEVTTDPPGLPVRAEPPDAVRRAGDGAFLLSPRVADEVAFVVDGPCRSGRRDVATEGEPAAIVVETEPVVWEIEVGSSPEGAFVTVDGERQAERTPTSVRLEACREHVVELGAPGRAPRVVELAAQESPDPWRAALAEVELGEPLAGEIVVSKAPWSVRVSVSGTRARGRAGEVISVPPGQRTIVLDAPEVFFHATRKVRVRPGERTRVEVAYPALGIVPFRSVPPGATVSIRDHRGRWRKIGRTQIAGQRLVEGEYDVRFELEGRSAIERRIRVTPGRNRPVAVGARDWAGR
ncbi:MAG: serine/threonine protein kinase [Acidobacteria bacterium]|nr:MAG: serine/threonine protein kinase [Acidobacteriota bacterium]